MAIKQLSPPLPMVTTKGKGLAHFLIDYGIESHLHWVVFLDDTGECWTFQNPDVRAQKNITQGREYISPFYDPEDVQLNSYIELSKEDAALILETLKNKNADNILRIKQWFQDKIEGKCKEG